MGCGSFSSFVESFKQFTESIVKERAFIITWKVCFGATVQLAWYQLYDNILCKLLISIVSFSSWVLWFVVCIVAFLFYLETQKLYLIG